MLQQHPEQFDPQQHPEQFDPQRFLETVERLMIYIEDFKNSPIRGTEDETGVLKDFLSDVDLGRLTLQRIWEYYLKDKRDENSERQDSLRDREIEEDRLFDQALTLLPLWRKLDIAAKEIALLQGKPIPDESGGIDEGLKYLQQGRWEEAFLLLAHANKDGAIQSRRRDYAARILDTVKVPVPVELFHAVWWIGAEWQRQKVFNLRRSSFAHTQRIGIGAGVVVLLLACLGFFVLRGFSIGAPPDATATPTSESIVVIGSPTVTVVVTPIVTPSVKPTVTLEAPVSPIPSTPVPTFTPTFTPIPPGQLVVGIRLEFLYSGRIAEDTYGPYTYTRVEPNVDSARGFVLRNDDRVQVIDTNTPEWYRIEVVANGDGSLVGSQGWIERWLIDGEPAPPTPTPTRIPPTPTPTRTRPPAPTPLPKLRIVRIDQSDNTTCISLRVTGIDTSGWTLTADGLPNSGSFGGGDVRVCGFSPGQQFTFTIRDAGGNPVPGGTSSAKGGDIFQGTWR